MKAVVFDMDGVLFDTERLGFAAWDYVSEKMNVPPASELAFQTLGMTAPAVDRVLKAHYGNDFNISRFRLLCREYTYRYFAENGVPQKPYLKESLAMLKAAGFKIALASSTASAGVCRNLKDADIETDFDSVICVDMIKNSKPAPDIYLAAARSLGVLPAECFAVEDSKNGVLSAYRAGMKVIMVPDLWGGDEETDKLLFSKCADLKAAAETILKEN